QLVDAFGGAHADPKGAARAKIHLVGRHRESARSPLPMLQVLGLGPRLKDEGAWRIEDTRDEKLGRGLLGRRAIFSCGHITPSPASGQAPSPRPPAPRSAGT